MADGISITSSDELRDWHKSRPKEWARVIAMRVVLRVFPIVGKVYESTSLSSEIKNRLVKIACRACFISWAVSKYPARDMKQAAPAAASAAAAAAAAASASSSSSSSSSASAAFAYASAYAAANASAADYASTSSSASMAYAYAYDSAAADMWNAITADANRLTDNSGKLENAGAASALAGSALWPQGEPQWLTKQRQAFFALPLENLDVWRDWYERVLEGRPPFGLGAEKDEELTVKIALQEDEFWERDFEVVSGEIKKWVDEARGEGESSTGNREASQTVTSGVRENAVTVLGNATGIRELAWNSRLELEKAKPNDAEGLEDWENKYALIDKIENMAGEMVDALAGVQKPGELEPAVEKTAGILQELLTEFENWMKNNKPEMVDAVARTSVALPLVGLANLVGATMPIATLAIFAIVGGKKVYEILKGKGKGEG